jgi:hypothetical protein
MLDVLEELGVTALRGAPLSSIRAQDPGSGPAAFLRKQTSAREREETPSWMAMAARRGTAAAQTHEVLQRPDESGGSAPRQRDKAEGPVGRGRTERAGAVRFVPPERKIVRNFTVDVAQQRTAHRREGELVKRYTNYLDGLGLEYHRLEMPLESSRLLNDVFVPARNHLVEAKGDVARESIRMAIGQIADYLHQLSKDDSFGANPPEPAVLLPRDPGGSARELLQSQGIAAIWETVEGEFSDDAGGRFTGG